MRRGFAVRAAETAQSAILPCSGRFAIRELSLAVSWPPCKGGCHWHVYMTMAGGLACVFIRFADFLCHGAAEAPPPRHAFYLNVSIAYLFPIMYSMGIKIQHVYS